jgi:hypothetical protein
MHMATMKMSKSAVERIKAPTASGKQEIAWDEQLHGLGILVSSVSPTKTWVVQGIRWGVEHGRCDKETADFLCRTLTEIRMRRKELGIPAYEH